MAEIVLLSGALLIGEPVAATPSRSSNPLNSLTPTQANAWQAQQDRLAREAYARARPASPASQMFGNLVRR